VTLIEPQKIASKKKRQTYRIWDWNRLYDERGNVSPAGKPRELHIEDSLRVIDFDAARVKRLFIIFSRNGRSCNSMKQAWKRCGGYRRFWSEAARSGNGNDLQEIVPPAFMA
jgi:hypothetical protein